jgi:hypothetical protein
MRIQQLSIFLENRAGTLRKVCDLLAQSKVNVSTLLLADTKEFGVLRLLIRDWEQAKRALEKGGYAVNQTEVLAVEVEDRPGGLTEILKPLEAADINIEYMYAFNIGRKGKVVDIFRFGNLDRAEAALKAAGVNVLDDVELFGA